MKSNAMQKRGSVFQNVAGLHPSYSMFDLSYVKTMTADMGTLYPIMCDEVVPGDIFKIGNQMVVRVQPMVAPILHEMNVYVHYFFVPYRILDENFEDFITGGANGNSTQFLPLLQPTLGETAVGTIWDYLGFQTGVVPSDSAAPIAYPLYAYNTIFNEYYRDETLRSEVSKGEFALRTRCWEKDYFTSSLPWQQRGTAPALPISGITSAVFPSANFSNDPSESIPAARFTNAAGFGGLKINGSTALTHATSFFNDNTVDLSSATTFNVADLRLVFQIQKFLERNARAGARYTEFLASHFGVSPRDERLQRPEYIGGSKSPVIVSEVLQTTSTDATSPQGHMAGHGIAIGSQICGKYRATEFGLIMGIMSIMPRTMYQTGHNRQWLRRTKYDFYFPEFANLSEQAISNSEIYVSGTDNTDKAIFGYQGRYDEMRTKQNMVCGQMRDVFSYWHLSRQFSSTPALNNTFVGCFPRKDFLAAPDEPAFILQVANLVKAWRPMPIQSNPGLIDHN